MKRIVAGGLVVCFLLAPFAVVQSEAQPSPGAAALLSAILPGTGEWYNRGFEGSFPWGECIVGNICFFVQVSSILDAVNGNTDEGIRFDFWTAPQR